MSNSNNYRWIQFSQVIPRNGWQFKEITGARGNVAWGYEKSLQVQGGNIENNDYEKLYFDFLLIPGQSDFMKIRVCFPWLRGNIIYGSAWFYDYCVIKMGFKDHHDKVVMTKYFHVEPENQCCNMADHSSTEEVASFYSDSFFINSEFEKLCKYKADRVKPDFIPIDVSVTLRVHKGYRKDLFLPHADLQFSFSSLWGTAVGKTTTSNGHLVGRKKLRANSSAADVVFVMKAQESKGKVNSVKSLERRKVASNKSGGQGEGKGSDLITAHKAVLMAHSPVFEKMFQVQMKERETGLVEIKDDLNPFALRAFLDFIYDVPNETLIGDIGLTLEVLQLAHKYQVEELTQFCIQAIIGNPNSAFSVKIAMDVVSAGTVYNVRDLKFRSAQWINRNKADLKPEEFQCLMEQFTEDEQLLFSCLRF